MSGARTKHVCTIGPASIGLVPQLVAAGMDVARVNFSHGTPDDHRDYVHAVRAAAHAAHRSVAVMADLPGSKLRLGTLEGDQLRLETGATFALRADDGTPGVASGAGLAQGDVIAQLQPGDRVLLADGAAELRVTEPGSDQVITEVVNGGLIRTRCGVSVPRERLPARGLTEADREAIPRALELRVDLVAQSFVGAADDVRELRALLPADGPRVVAKIESQAAVAAFDAIAAESDGIMVARGDLGIDLPFEEVPVVQKDLVSRALAAGKFVIVATQMLESMTGAPRPTRAEASDVANAVLDGADAVMLSAETAVGQFPLESLQAMERICVQAEAIDRGDFLPSEDDSPSALIVEAAAMLTLRRAWGLGNGPDAIWCFTRSGRTAEQLSLQRPGVPIVAFTLSPIVARRLAVRRGVMPIVLPANARSGTLIERMENAWRAQGNGAEHRHVVLVTTSHSDSGINRLEIHRLGEPAAT
jgi:pyruvate kinase